MSAVGRVCNKDGVLRPGKPSRRHGQDGRAERLERSRLCSSVPHLCGEGLWPELRWASVVLTVTHPRDQRPGGVSFARTTSRPNAIPGHSPSPHRCGTACSPSREPLQPLCVPRPSWRCRRGLPGRRTPSLLQTRPTADIIFLAHDPGPTLQSRAVDQPLPGIRGAPSRCCWRSISSITSIATSSPPSSRASARPSSAATARTRMAKTGLLATAFLVSYMLTGSPVWLAGRPHVAVAPRRCQRASCGAWPAALRAWRRRSEPC